MVKMAEGGIILSAVLCELCEKEPAQSFCRTCSGNLCEKCTTEHKSKKIFYRHDVVKMTLTRQMEKDGFGFCQKHPESRYELCCQDCTMPVCTKCIAGLHNGHKMTDISSAYIEAKGKITSNVKEIETSLCPKYRKRLDDLDDVLSDINKQTDNVEQTVLSRSKELTEFIHAIEKEILKKISQEKKDLINLIVSFKKEITDHLSTLQSLQNELIQERDSESMTDLILYTENNFKIPHKNKDFPTVCFQEAFFAVMKRFPDEFKDLFGMYLPSTIVVHSRKRIMSTAKEVARFKTATKNPVGVFCSRLNADLAWIRGPDAEIKKIDVQGNELATVMAVTKLGRPSGLIELDDGSIFFSDIENKQVKHISKHMQEEADIKFDWYPMGLCVSLSGHILVCTAFLPWNAADTSDCGKVLKMNYKGVTLQEIDKDSEGKYFYGRPICISENINQDICVSDVCRHSMIVVNKTGLFRFAYNGGGIHKDREEFAPVELDTDSIGNIAVSDRKNSLVHLLDIDGNLVKYLLSTKDGISEPRGLKVDKEDRIWITEITTGYVKIFKYLE